MTNQENYNFNQPPKKNNAGIAIALIVIGVLFLLKNLGFIPYGISSFIFTWQTLLIGIGIWNIFKKNYVSATVLIVIGVFFILPNLGIYVPNLAFYARPRITWPIILIIIGVVIYFGKNKNKNYRYQFDNSQQNNSTFNTTNEEPNTQQHYTSNQYLEYIDESVIFSNSTKFILSQNLKGGDVSVVFGEMIIDLRRAKLAGDRAMLELDTVFGSTIVFAPDDWNIQISNQTILGSFYDKRFTNTTTYKEGKPLLIITGNTILGSSEIRS